MCASLEDHVATTRARLRNVIVRHQRGLVIADDEADLLIQVGNLLDVEAARIKSEFDVVRAEEREACASIADTERKTCEAQAEAGKRRLANQASAQAAKTIASRIRGR